MHERDQLNPEETMYVVTPTPMMEWMELFVSDSITHKSKICLVPSKNLNPEPNYYYQTYEDNSYRDVKNNELLDKTDTRPLVSSCPPKSDQEID